MKYDAISNLIYFINVQMGVFDISLVSFKK